MDGTKHLARTGFGGRIQRQAKAVNGKQDTANAERSRSLTDYEMLVMLKDTTLDMLEARLREWCLICE